MRRDGKFHSLVFIDDIKALPRSFLNLQMLRLVLHLKMHIRLFFWAWSGRFPSAIAL
jgi:hypothetical protein